MRSYKISYISYMLYYIISWYHSIQKCNIIYILIWYHSLISYVLYDITYDIIYDICTFSMVLDCLVQIQELLFVAWSSRRNSLFEKTLDAASSSRAGKYLAWEGVIILVIYDIMYDIITIYMILYRDIIFKDVWHHIMIS